MDAQQARNFLYGLKDWRPLEEMPELIEGIKEVAEVLRTAEEAPVIANIKASLSLLDADINRLAQIDPEARNACNAALTKLEDLRWWLENGVFPSQE